MSYLVDTDVLSEATKKTPNPAVRRWLAEHQRELYVSTITIGEMRYGIEKLPRGKRHTALQSWLTETCRIMDGRILSFNISVAHVWGTMRAALFKTGQIMPMADSQIAAIATRYELTVATRNAKDFLHYGIKTIDPFDLT